MSEKRRIVRDNCSVTTNWTKGTLSGRSVSRVAITGEPDSGEADTGEADVGEADAGDPDYR